MMDRLFKSAAHDMGSRVEGVVNGVAQRAGDLERGYDQASVKAQHAIDVAARAVEANGARALKQMQAHPLPVIAAVALVGFIAGYLASTAAREPRH